MEISVFRPAGAQPISLRSFPGALPAGRYRSGAALRVTSPWIGGEKQNRHDQDHACSRKMECYCLTSGAAFWRPFSVSSLYRLDEDVVGAGVSAAGGRAGITGALAASGGGVRGCGAGGIDNGGILPGQGDALRLRLGADALNIPCGEGIDPALLRLLAVEAGEELLLLVGRSGSSRGRPRPG